MATRLLLNAAILLSQTAPMGALTLANSANGYQIVTGAGVAATNVTDAGGGTATGYSLTSGGLIYPSTNGSLSAQDGKTIKVNSDQGPCTITLSVEPNVYSCGQGQLSAIMSLGSATIDGKTIKGRPSADIQSTTPGNSYTFANTLLFTAGLTITSHDPARPCFLRRIVPRHDGKITLSQLVMRDDYLTATDNNSVPLCQWANPASGRRSEMEWDRIEAYCTNSPSTYDGTTVASGTKGAHTGGVSSTTVQLTNSPDLSAVAAAPSGTYNIAFNTSTVRRIVSADNTAKTVVVSSAVTYSSGASAADYGIALTPQYLCIMSNAGGITLLPRVNVHDCLFRDFNFGIGGLFQSFTAERNLFGARFSDAITLNVNGEETNVLIKDNVMGACYGIATYVGNPHSDAIQLLASSITQANSPAYQIIGNRVWPKGSTGQQQGGFISLSPAAYPMLSTVMHNIVHDCAVNGTYQSFFGTGSSAKWNTVVKDQASRPADTSYAPTVRFVSEYSAAECANNAAHGFTYDTSPLTSAAATNNYTFTGATETDIATALVGPTFSSADYATLADWTAAMMPKPGGPLDTASPKIGAGAYYIFDNTPPPTGSRSGLGTGLATI